MSLEQQLADALAELIACKDLHDEEQRLRSRRIVYISRNPQELAKVNVMRDEYNRRKPLAWKKARFVLASFSASKVEQVRPTSCKFANGGASCVSHCGDPICMKKL